MSYEKGKIFIQRGKYKNAILIFEKLIREKSSDLRANFFLGKIYYNLNNLNKSLFFYNNCNKIKPKTPNVLFNLALVLQGVGKIEEAKKIYLELISINSNDIQSYYGLAILNIDNINQNHIKKLKIILRTNKINLYEQSLINFIFSKIKKKEMNVKDEISLLNLSHKQNYNSNLKYNNDSNFYYKEIISKHFDKVKFYNNFKNVKKFNLANNIFIIGLPRSGSTLVETIISHNSNKIKSVGEFHAVNKTILEQIGPTVLSKNFKFIIDREKFQNSIFEKYENVQNFTFLDKSLENFFNIDVILEFFPNAKFIHTYRNQEDSIIGIYQRLLAELSWAHNLNDIKKYVRQYNITIQYFKKKYPNQILDIDLSKLTIEKEKEAKKILEFCNIKYDKNFLNFHKNKNLYNKTNSFLQVRNKIEKYKTNQYLPYYYLLDEFHKNK